MSIPHAGWAACIGVALVLCAAACGDDRPASKSNGARRDSTTVPADTTLRTNLPAGRYHLPTKHTPAPDFFVSLPAGYMVKDLSKLPNDEYFIVQSNDPSLRDSAAITPGFMMFSVGVRPQSAIERGRTHDERSLMLGRTMIVWKLWSDTLPTGAPYYMREFSSHDYFAAISADLARAPLHLHVYIAGRDSARVAELMHAAETLGLSP